MSARRMNLPVTPGRIAGALVIALMAALPVAASAQSVPPAACTTEVSFSPEGHAAELVLRTLDGARKSIDLAAYSFTSPEVVQHLIDAKRRGVKVRVLVDEKGNQSRASHAALNLLVNAGIPTRTIRIYPIHHDKYMVIDGQTVETGSFNYTRAAAQRNSENALVVRNCPALARQYLAHWQSRWRKGQKWRLEY